MAKPFSPKGVILRDLISLRDELQKAGNVVYAGFLSSVIERISKDLENK